MQSPSNPELPVWRRWWRSILASEPTFASAILPYCVLAIALFTRHPTRTNFIYDEQEALLANPYVRSAAESVPKLGVWQVFTVDFWGRSPEGTIGSYRPLPNLVWRAAWWCTVKLRGLGHAVGRDSPFLCHWVNVLLHGIVAALFAGCLYRWTRDKVLSWAAGAAFVGAAILTEAVSGVVGLADVLSALGIMLAVAALALPAWLMPCGVFLGCVFGLFSKESALCTIALVPVVAFASAPSLHPQAPRPWLRALLGLGSSIGAFVYYVTLRKKLFPTKLPESLLAESFAGAAWPQRAAGAFLRWYHQPGTPHDVLNNPLVGVPTPLRVAGGLRVYARGLGQALLPLRLSGDYSTPQEPVPERFWSASTALGLALMLLPVLIGAVLLLVYTSRSRRRLDAEVPGPLLVGLAMLWVVLAFFPVSNIPVVLPTVRAERFWYVPMFGVATLLGLGLSWALRRTAPGGVAKGLVVAGFGSFLLLQGVQARAHANDYSDDLAFWDATRRAAPRSAKAHLNYSVMQGARGNLQERLRSSHTALRLAPEWPMASVYLADTLCRLHRTDEALPYYLDGFAKGPGEAGLIALGLQCLWDEKALQAPSEALDRLEDGAEQHPGSWYAFLVRDLVANGEQHKGVDPKHRPRGYNEGPK